MLWRFEDHFSSTYSKGDFIVIAFNHSSGEHLQVDDAKIYFELAGNPTGKPLLLLHGGMGNLTDFNGILNKLPNQFQLIGIDLRGHGKSTLGTSGMTYQQHQDDVEAVLAHLGIDCFSVLGFSDGGITAYRMAARTRSQINALVAVGAHGRIDPKDPVFTRLSGVTSEKWRQMFPDSVSYYTANNPAPDFEALVKAVVSLWTDTGASGYPGTSVKQITAPALIVRGDEDHLFSLGDAAELQEQIEGAAFLNIPFAGHEVHKDAPGLFLESVNEFLVNHRKN